MLSLKKSSTYKKDLKKYQTKIDSLKDGVLKTKCKKLIKDLDNQANIIDVAHSTDYNRFINPKDLRDNIEEMQRLRHELDILLNDA